MSKTENEASNGNPLQRHKTILAMLQRHGTAEVTRLATELKVSEVTIRKDLTFLEQEGKLYRTHGKAILLNPYTGNRHINEKEKKCINEKRAIAVKAAGMIGDEDSIIIASGTSLIALAREIPQEKNLTVITSSIPVTQILSQHSGINVIQLGGITRKSSVSVVGPFAGQMLSNFKCNTLFLGVDGIDPDFGITTTDTLEAELNRMMMKAAQKVIVLADNTKFGRSGFSKICNIEDIDLIITDSGIPQMHLDNLRLKGIDIAITEA